MNGYSLDSLYTLTEGKPRRVSSYDRSGGNHDWMDLPAGQTKELCRLQGPGVIRHIWCTHWTGDEHWQEEPLALRKLILRVYWDDEDSPSVEAPLGDFFGMPFGRRKNFSSAAFGMGPEDGRAMNCWWPMPFGRSARITVESRCQCHTNFYFYVDYEAWPRLPAGDTGYFHARFQRERDTQGWAPQEPGLLDREKAHVPEEPAWVPALWLQHKNVTGAGNYVILDAKGRGRYVGCVVGVELKTPQCNEWYGEGDDMIFIDGEPWPPSLHGTGTEDYFSCAFCPTQEFAAPYYGITCYSGDAAKAGHKFMGQNGMYRLHIRDPISFETSIRVTIEHGHANKLTGDWCSTAFWYQTEPHIPMIRCDDYLP